MTSALTESADYEQLHKQRTDVLWNSSQRLGFFGKPSPELSGYMIKKGLILLGIMVALSSF
jgi:hypothetical protein